jgi:RimJ/RimL family protein N-acetyltransferase
MCIVRPPREDDAPFLARGLADRAVWRNLRDRIPHPYRLADAEAWIRSVAGAPAWVVEVGGEAAGAICLHAGEDVYRRSGEIGFWLGRAHWGRGIMSEAVPAVAAHAFERFPDWCRLEAEVFAWNPRSMRVLEKSGFVREGVMRRAVFKDGEIVDSVLFARVVAP